MLLRSTWPKSQGKFPWLSSDVFPDRKARLECSVVGLLKGNCTHSPCDERISPSFPCRGGLHWTSSQNQCYPSIFSCKKAMRKHAPCLPCFIQSTALWSTTSLSLPAPAVILMAISAFLPSLSFSIWWPRADLSSLCSVTWLTSSPLKSALWMTWLCVKVLFQSSLELLHLTVLIDTEKILLIEILVEILIEVLVEILPSKATQFLFTALTWLKS